MAKNPKYLLNRDGRYFSRIVIPEELRPFLGNKTELREALGPDRRRALIAHHATVAGFHAKLAEAEKALIQAGGKPSTVRYPLTADEMAAQHYRSMLAFDTELRDFDHRYAENDIDDLRLADLRDGGAGRLPDDYLLELIGNVIERFRYRGNTDAAIGSTDWRRLARALCIAEYEFTARKVERDEGDFTGTPEAPMLIKALEENDNQPAEDESPFNSMTFTNIIDEQVRITALGLGGKPLSAATLKKYRSAVWDFEQHRRNKKVATITLIEAEAWRDSMLQSGDYSRKTVLDKLSAIRAILAWGQKQSKGKLFTNGVPLDHLDMPVPKRTDSAARTYTLEDAKHLLEFARTESRASRRWIPWVIAHTGARVNEITPLEREDIFERKGRWFIHIRDDETAGRSTKTHMGRKVPVHRDLLKEGFIDWVTQQPAGKLFPGGANEDQRIREWIREEVFPDRKDMPPPNHGFRHLFEDALYAGVSHRAALYITGRSTGSSADDYGGSDLRLLELAKQMDKVPSLL